MTMLIVIDARRKFCPEEYRELRRRYADDSTSSDADFDDDDQWREGICEQANQKRDSMPNRWMLKTFCPYSDEALQLAREKNDTLCQEKKRAIDIKRKRKADDDDDSSDSDDDQDKRQVLRKRELNKRLALRFLRKRLS